MKKPNILEKFSSLIFSVVGLNSPYKLKDFLHVLTEAAESRDFVNNTCNKTDAGPDDGQTVFRRLEYSTIEQIETTFYTILASILKPIKLVLRNRKVVLAFDETCEAFYGRVEKNALWIHEYKPLRGCNGSFQFLTVSIVIGEGRFILGSLPIPRHWNKADYIEKLINHARKFVRIESCLFDRGFTDFELIYRLKMHKLGYQILWKQDKKDEVERWTKKEFKKMKVGELKEIMRKGIFSRHKTKYKFKVRFVLIKQYKYKEDDKAYDWVFATNLKLKSQMWYLRKYKKRWGIETIFRVTDELRIRTSTLKQNIRYFLFVFTCLMYNLWKFAKIILKDKEDKITFAVFVRKLANIILDKIEHKRERLKWLELNGLIHAYNII